MERDEEEMMEAAAGEGEGEAKPKPKPAPAARRRTSLVRVDQEIIDRILKKPPGRPLPVFSDEVPEGSGKLGLRAKLAIAAATVQRIIDRDADIVHQYRTKGYAEVEEEVTDDDELAAVMKRKKPDTRRKRPATRKNSKLGRTG